MPALCRDCANPSPIPPASGRCPRCASPRVVAHPELDRLVLAHLDCDAFYATVEKRDDPGLQGKPVIVGGGRRGVVAACCYIARTRGVHSAMPIFQARKRCPDAVVIRPDMDKYREVGAQVRALMREVSPLVEPLSVDEAFIDLSGTEALHGGSPARTLVRLVRRIETKVGITASIGLSYNKFLAKVASDLDKPRGFAVIGRAEAAEFLAVRPVSLLWGVGKVLHRRLEKDGIGTIGQLGSVPEATLIKRYGAIGHRLALFARGEDDRQVEPSAPAKSLSSETTFEEDVADPATLARELWRMSEKLAKRLKQKGLGGGGVVLKLKTADFRLRTRSCQLAHPTQLAEVLYRAALPLLEREADGTRFRLLGVGTSRLADAADADPPDLADPDGARRLGIERAMDSVRARFGDGAIVKGRGWSGQ